jgi:Flp pilus assembly protein TadD
VLSLPIHLIPTSSSSIAKLLSNGLDHHQAGRLGEAERAYRKILELDAHHAEALHLLGMVAFQTGHCDAAAELISRAILRNGKDATYFSNLGNVLQTQGRLEEAVGCYRRALQLNPASAATCGNLGLALQFLGSLEEASKSFELALELDPGVAITHTNLGNVRQAQGRLEEAAACHKWALAIEPTNPEAHSNLGGVLDLQGKVTESMAAYDRALALKPDFTVALFNRSLLLLRGGDFAAGLPDYEHRWCVSKRRDFIQPQWYGQPLKGVRILLYAEQGLGDTVQFLRYLPLVRAAGGEVILEVQPQMRRLALRLPDVAELICPGDPLPPFDWHCPLMSLPLAFGTSVESIPASAPYLSVSEEAVDAAAQKLRDGREKGKDLRVGIAWAGSPAHLRDRFRSIPLRLLEPLFGLAGAQFFSLQLGPAAAELTDTSGRVTDLGPEIEDMADSASLIANLNLVIAVDTAVAHLAGALAKPVWVLLPFSPDWRWFLDREDSPWYPAMRLFRQPALGDWGPVVGAMRSALVEKIAAYAHEGNL